MRTQWTRKGNRDAGSSWLCDGGLHRYLRNFGGGGGLNTPNPPFGTPLVRDEKVTERARFSDRAAAPAARKEWKQRQRILGNEYNKAQIELVACWLQLGLYTHVYIGVLLQ